MRDYHHILRLFKDIYGDQLSETFRNELTSLLDSFVEFLDKHPASGLTEHDSILITYGDAIKARNMSPLQALNTFLTSEVKSVIGAIHLLPFFPYSSDDGFSVIDYYQVDPEIGSWDDIAQLARNYDLMFDAVINHVSIQSSWFQKFLTGDDLFSKYFITVDGGTDLSEVFRPRALPLLTTFQTVQGLKQVWTTFSEDQVDLNFHHPEVLLDILQILLMFVQRKARFIRLDAIAYIWKEVGTSCIHLENAHRIVQFFRAVFNQLAPYVQIITETNVPHKDNIAYFGNGSNEAQLVYNFSLPPLVLHSFHQETTSVLTYWAKSLELPSNQTSYFNFLASHDGIGITPAKGLISDHEIHTMCERVTRLGGYVSYKDNPDGTRSPYELNINYLDALADPEVYEEPTSIIADRFLASQSIMLVLKGVPGIYYHSLLGSKSWREGVRKTGRSRTINREKLELDNLLNEIHQKDSLRHIIFNEYISMLKARASALYHAFSPSGAQKVLEVHDKLFVILRTDRNQAAKVLCVTTVSHEPISVEIDNRNAGLFGWEFHKALYARNASCKVFQNKTQLQMGPYGVLWILLVND